MSIAIEYMLFELKPAIPKQQLPDFSVCYEAMVVTEEWQDLIPNFKIITTQGITLTGERTKDYPADYGDGWLNIHVPGTKLSIDTVKNTIGDWLGTAYQVTAIDSCKHGYM